VYLFVVVAPRSGTFGFDAYAYWTVNPADPYGVTAGGLGAFTYTPAIAFLFAPFAQLEWFTFLWLWSGVLVASVVWLGWRQALLVFAFPPVALELYHGNVHLLIAAAVVLGFRYPAVWAFPILTKVTPGVGLIWFAVRREWRRLAIALGVTGAIAATTFLIAPQLWSEWLTQNVLKTAAGEPLGQISIAIPLVARLPLSVVLVTWGARTNRPWTVPAAATLALPILWVSGLATLAAIVAIRQRRPGLTGPDVISLRP
jgi:hypothetical protein